MSTAPRRMTDWPVAFAIGLLLAVLGWRIALAALALPPLQANALLAPPPGATAATNRLVLVVDGDLAGETDAAARGVQRTHPGWTLEIQRVPWRTNAGERSREGRIAALVRGYGHDELPVLLTLGPEGQVLRVQSLREAR